LLKTSADFAARERDRAGTVGEGGQLSWDQWQQCGELIASAWAIYGAVKLSWTAGARFWARR